MPRNPYLPPQINLTPRIDCCCEDGGDILSLLMNSNFPSSPFPSPTSSTLISPMNSHFSALSTTDILRLIFQNLPISDLARANCVCRLWNSVASERQIVTKSFLAQWKLKDVVHEPLSGSFWRDRNIGKFVFSHRIVRGDTVATLAVKYSVQVMDIKCLNNMVSDYINRLRERLLIPISNPDILINRTCFIEQDVYSKREVAVLYPNDVPNIRKRCFSTRVSSEESKKRVVYSLKRSMQVDNETTQYYLSVSNGDP